MREQAIIKERIAGRHWKGDRLLAAHLLVWNLPVPILDVYLWALSVTAIDCLEAAILDIGMIERDPNPNNPGFNREVEVGVILMPGLFATDPRWASASA